RGSSQNRSGQIDVLGGGIGSRPASDWSWRQLRRPPRSGAIRRGVSMRALCLPAGLVAICTALSPTVAHAQFKPAALIKDIYVGATSSSPGSTDSSNANGLVLYDDMYFPAR